MKKCKNCNANVTDKFKNGLCNKCYKDGFPERLIKARIAETIVEQMFLKMNYNVYRYGMEHTVPRLINLIEDKNSEVERKIRKMPDFVIEKEGKINFIEVKFRANGKLDKSDFKGYPYPEAYVILVSLDNVKCIQIKQLIEGVKINIKANSYLIEASEFYEKEYKSDFDNLIFTLKKFYLVLNK